MKCATRKSNFYFHYSILIQLSRLTAGAKNSFCPYGRYLKTKIQYYYPTSAVHLILTPIISQIFKLVLLIKSKKTYYIVFIFSSVRRCKNKAMPTYTLLRSVWGLPTVACRRLKTKPRSTSTSEFFLRKTKTSIVALEIYILV